MNNNPPRRSGDQSSRRRAFSDDNYPSSKPWFADRRSETDSREVGEVSPPMRDRQSDRGRLWPDSPNEGLLEDIFTNSTPRPDSPPLPQLVGHEAAGTQPHRRRHGSERASPLFARDEDSRAGFGKDSMLSKMKDPLMPADRSPHAGSPSLVSPATSLHRMPAVEYCDPTNNDALSSKLVAYGLPVPECRPSAHLPVIEIAPGVCARLRGAQETWKCIENDFYTPVVCFDCNADLCCIQDADYVLCPRCRVVSPMEGDYPKRLGDGGVGLGFTMEDLFRWQGEILSSR